MSSIQNNFFQELGLSIELIQALSKSNIYEPTEIQRQSIPQILSGGDHLIEAQTGSGKTICFVLPLLQKISAEKTKTKEIKALILTPTRELALQASGAIFRLGEFLPNKVTHLTIIGGESITQQTNTLENGVDIIIATPGRLLDLIGQNIIQLNSIKYLVLDEADKILDQGFAIELDSLLSELSTSRQTLFFSATYPPKIMDLIGRLSQNTTKIALENQAPAVENISQRVILVNKENKGMLLRHLIKTEKWNNALIFVASKVAAHNLTEKLKKIGIRANCIHGDLSQPERNKALSDFKNKKTDFLIATDIAGRGIDIDKLKMVINFDLPRSPADYIHRIGRTGRAGEKGLAISFVGHSDIEHFKLIEKRAEINLPREEVSGFELKGEVESVKKGSAPIKGKRKSKKDKLREKINS